jgi:hypothetical protein
MDFVSVDYSHFYQLIDLSSQLLLILDCCAVDEFIGFDGFVANGWF